MKKLPYPQKNRRILRRAVRIRIESEYCDACMEAFRAQVDNERPGHIWIVDKGRVMCLEDMVMELELGRKLRNDEIVVHRNGDVLDCRRENLEVVNLEGLL